MVAVLLPVAGCLATAAAAPPTPLELRHHRCPSLPLWLKRVLPPPPAGKFLGFLLRSIFLVNGDINVIAASTVFITAGMSACTSAQAAVLSDW